MNQWLDNNTLKMLSVDANLMCPIQDPWAKWSLSQHFMWQWKLQRLMYYYLCYFTCKWWHPTTRWRYIRFKSSHQPVVSKNVVKWDFMLQNILATSYFWTLSPHHHCRVSLCVYLVLLRCACLHVSVSLTLSAWLWADCPHVASAICPVQAVWLVSFTSRQEEFSGVCKFYLGTI